MIRAFILGVIEFRLSITTRCEHDHAYELGREWAHRLTFRAFDK